jgi:RsiW-degrading membrane proteinase PrsW (M82 family)
MIGITLCFVPLILAIVFFSTCFKLKITHQLIAVLLGLAAVLPISFIQYFMPSIPGLPISPVVSALLKSLLLYGLVEEAIKTLALLPLPHKIYDEEGATDPAAGRLNFLLLAFTAGLSLGCFESVVYYFDHLQIANSRGATLLYGQIAVRIFTSDIIHMMCTGLCGLFVYSCRSKTCRLSCLIAAVLLHGIYDFFAGFSGGLRWFSVAVVLMAIAECRIKYNSLTTEANATN